MNKTIDRFLCLKALNKTKKWYIFFPVNELVDSGFEFFLSKKI
jgi:hypothetical protein